MREIRVLQSCVSFSLFLAVFRAYKHIKRNYERCRALCRDVMQRNVISGFPWAARSIDRFLSVPTIVHHGCFFFVSDSTHAPSWLTCSSRVRIAGSANNIVSDLVSFGSHSYWPYIWLQVFSTYFLSHDKF